MCGITGIAVFNKEEIIKEYILKTMCKSIAHRGPDGEGIFISEDKKIGLGHRRLSIIDLTTGQQPMSNQDKSLWIVFNGEIYNYKEIKERLIKKGYEFETSSDTEVIIKLFEDKKENSFKELNGIFAFALYDMKNKNLFLVRDEFGVKPLYYSLKNGKLIFGSEIKAILNENTIKREINYNGLHSYLTYRYNPSDQTLFKNINKLLPGHYLKLNQRGKIIIDEFDKTSPLYNPKINIDDAIEEYLYLLDKSVKKQLVSDVPVGIFLSGGIDSCSIGMLMRKYYKSNINSFTVGFTEKGKFNELAQAKRNAKLINTTHHDIKISLNDYLNFYQDSFYYTEEPIAEPTIPALWYLSRLASKKVKVVLAGQGADEAFAGYHRYIAANYIEKYPKIFHGNLLKILGPLFIGNEKLRRSFETVKKKNQIDRFLSIYTIFNENEKDTLLRNDIKCLMNNEDMKILSTWYKKSLYFKEPLSRMLYIDKRMKLSDDLLLFNDKMTMANSIEMRVPFLDKDLIRFIESLPTKHFIKKIETKYLHKKAMLKILPRKNVNAKKKGFETPIGRWLKSNLGHTAYQILNKKNAAVRNYFKIDEINNLLEKNIKKNNNWNRHIFQLLSFELWHKNFFEEVRVPDLKKYK